MSKGSPFASFLIIGSTSDLLCSTRRIQANTINLATCFFLGLLFASFPYDYYVLWATPQVSDSALGLTDSAAIAAAREPYMARLETHLRIMHQSPHLINRILHIAIGTGLLGFLVKLYKPSEANMLFDGASLVLYMCGITVYVANIVKGLRVVTEGSYGLDASGKPLDVEGYEAGSAVVMGRDDSLRVLAASNTILAVILMGVLILQAGQWYAQKREEAEIDDFRLQDEKKATAKAQGAVGDKGKVEAKKNK